MAILLSLRGSVATAAIPWSKVRSICFSLFRWGSSLSLKMTYQKKYVILSVAKYPTTKEKSIYRLLIRWDSSLSFRMTCKKVRHIERSEISHRMGDGVYHLRKLTLPGDCFASLAKTVKQIPLPPSGEVAQSADRG